MVKFTTFRKKKHTASIFRVTELVQVDANGNLREKRVCYMRRFKGVWRVTRKEGRKERRGDGVVPSQWEIHATLIPSNYLFIQFKHNGDGDSTFLRNVVIFNPLRGEQTQKRTIRANKMFVKVTRNIYFSFVRI
jgi:hypothetical protein